VFISNLHYIYRDYVFLAMFNNSVVKPFIIADNNALSHLGRGDFVLPVFFSKGILSEGDFVRGDFVRFPVPSGYFYRAMLAQSAVMRLHVVCLSVCNVQVPGSGVVPLRHLARAPQAVLRLWLTVALHIRVFSDPGVGNAMLSPVLNNTVPSGSMTL